MPSEPPHPNLYVVYDAEWENFVEIETEASYEALDNLFDKLCLNGTVDVVAGAFYHPEYHTIYCSETVARKAFAGDPTFVALLKHEKGHQEGVPLENHPTGPMMVVHAFRCWFDYRAGTRLFRLREGTAPPGFDAWFKSNQRMWLGSALIPQHPPMRNGR